MTKKGLIAFIVALCFSVASIIPLFSIQGSIADAKTSASKKKTAKKSSKSKAKPSRKAKAKASKGKTAPTQSYAQDGFYLITLPTTKRNVASIQKRIQQKTGLSFSRMAKYQLQTTVTGNIVPGVITASKKLGIKARVAQVPAPTPVMTPDIRVKLLKDKLSINNKGAILIAVDAGHGGSDSGAIGSVAKNATETVPIYEKDVNLSVALKLETLLRSAGYNVLMIRSTDVFVPLEERSNIANRADADIFVSIHHNSSYSPAAGGTEVYSYPGSWSGAAMAQAIQSELVNALWTATETASKDRGTNTANFSVLRRTTMSSSLSEAAFLSNPSEAALIESSTVDFCAKEADGLFAGITRFFNQLLK